MPLRVSGVMAGVTLGVSALIETAYIQGNGGSLPLAELLMVMAFSAGFWHNTGRLGGNSVEWRRVAILTAQFLIALAVTMELVFVAVAALPLVVGRRRALPWLGALMLIVILLTTLSAAAGEFAVSEIVASAPRPLGILLTILMMLVWTSFSFSAGYLILSLEESRRQTEWALAQVEGSQHLLAETTRLGERLRISRELHDAVGHHLMGLSVSLEVASHRAGAEAVPAIERAQLVTRLLLAEIRDVLSHVREDRALELRPVLEKLAAALPEPVCHLEVAEDAGPLTPDVARALFRSAQEALTNAARHSGARNVWLKIRPADGRLLFEARDDGRGAARVEMGNGLRGMRERFADLGGALQVHSEAASGFTLRGWLPLVSAGQER